MVVPVIAVKVALAAVKPVVLGTVAVVAAARGADLLVSMVNMRIETQARCAFLGC